MIIIKRFLIPLIIAFGWGIYLSVTHLEYNQVLTVAKIGAAVILCAVLFMITVFFVVKRLKFLIKHFILGICAIAFLCFGMFYVHIYLQVPENDIRNYEGEWVQLSGTIIMPPKLSSSGKNTQYIVQPDNIVIKKQTIPVSGKLIIHTPVAEQTLSYGNGITCRVKLEPPTTAQEKSDFDYAFYLKQLEIYISCYAREVNQIPAPPSFNPNSIPALGMKIRNSITVSIDKQMDSLFSKRYGNDISALLKGILVGDKTDFSPELYGNFSKTGISHIAAVSGMHITILFTALIFLLDKARIKKKLAYIIVMLVLVFFMAVALYTPSVMRASIMMIIFLFSYMINRDHDALTALFIAAGVMLFQNPHTLFSVGFILSFASTLCLIIYTPLVSPRLKILRKIPKIGKYLQEGLAVSLSVAIGTVYFVAAFFGIFSLAPFLINLFVIPLMLFVFSAGYAVWFLDIIRLGFVAKILSCVLSLPLIFVIELAKFFAHIPFIWYSIPAPKEWMFYVYLTLCVLLYLGLKSLNSLKISE